MVRADRKAAQNGQKDAIGQRTVGNEAAGWSRADQVGPWEGPT